ncbi:MAG: PBP1A family penicillin-binding protein [Alphaproteobacteria bacterium]|nr:PBP1A family penicillin-binding protein [Alphaproteobacteria bacterium]MDE2042589.1 PBP1A family penicillin-binding protein [Alphaproteobacteria bacterium]MDE2339952.1 PBP1A family penicillin-binding protein [Alphaproteobacteria bacterium]
MARRPTVDRKADKPRRGWFRKLLWIGFSFALLAAIGIAVMVGVAYQALPDYDTMKSSPNGQMIRVHADDGSVLVSLGPNYGEWIAYNDIPQVMKDAIVSIEDRRYWSHIGVDPVGIARSLTIDLTQKHYRQGASTITQQLARNVFLTNSKSVGRKVREAILAMAMERKYGKEEILEAYLNKAYFGGGSYGIDAASRRFFGHPATHMSLAEAAIIAGLVKAPSSYAPTSDADAAVARARLVIDAMRDNGRISADQAANVNFDAVAIKPEPVQNSVRYFTDWALPQLDTLIDDKTDPLDVWTTLDPAMQRVATDAIRTSVPGGAQGALISLDRDGAVRAMVGGTDYVKSNYNRGTKAERQPGSAFKLFVYLTALEAGKKPSDPEVDSPVTINGWSPRNANGRYSGQINIRTAFAYSVNTVAAKLGQELGTGAIADMARRFGITTPINTEPAMVLGSSDVRLIEMTQAFASIAAKGVMVTPYGITRITGAHSNILYQFHPDTSRVLVSPQVAAGITDLLQTAVNTGTGRAAQIGRPVAGKTGTTSSNKDGWFLGFSSGLTTGVWMGRDDNRPVGSLQGGHAPARAWAKFMQVAVANRPVEQFATQVTLPEWQLEPDADAYYGSANASDNSTESLGMEPDSGAAPADGGGGQPTQKFDQQWIDQASGRNRNNGGGSQRTPAPASGGDGQWQGQGGN